MTNASITQLVLFIAALTVAAGVVTTLTANVADISNAVSQRGDGVANTIETEINIISDPGSPSAIYNDTNNQITLLIKNSGEQSLTPDAEKLDVFVDGEYVTITNVSVVGNPGALTWQRGEVVNVTMSHTLAAGEHRVVAHVNEDKDVLEFRTT
jgi:flagellar protein FlaG